MKLWIDNRDKNFSLEAYFEDELLRVLNIAKEEEGLEGEYEVSLSLVEGQDIKDLNRQYRGVDEVTDVLSFPLGQEEKDLYEQIGQPIPLGDIVICMDRVRDQAKEFGHSEKREILYLTVHSFLHLLGYDHMTAEDKEEMRAQEKKIMGRFGVYKDENWTAEKEKPEHESHKGEDLGKQKEEIYQKQDEEQV